MLLEVSWEVCNQVGGIYTVLRTKAQAVLSRYPQRYMLVGPYFRAKANLEFEEEAPPPTLGAALEDGFSTGLYHYGRWLVPGQPPVLLVDCDMSEHELNLSKESLWRDYKISTLQPDGLVDDAVRFGFSVWRVVEALSQANQSIILHAHEWQSGVVLLEAAKHPERRVRTVFTTHATLIGRYEASNNPRFYSSMGTIDAAARAKHYGIEARHAIEKAVIQASEVFTTVSDVTGSEAAEFLGRGPDAILPNGLNAFHFTAGHEFQNLHLHFKKQIHEFVMGHFFPSYTFDLDKTLYLFTSGRYEYRNKGMDIFIEALALLRERLKKLPDPPTIVVFIITKTETTSIKSEVLKGQLMFHDLKVVADDINRDMGARLLDSVLARRLPTYEELLPLDALTRIKRVTHAFSRTTNPAITTHELVNEEHDPVLAHLARYGFTNAAEDPVKFVFHPEFMTATSPLIGLDYDQFVRGCHVGVFPSYYEPWGYTPLECIAMGVPTVTTDLSGFGSFVKSTIPNAWEQGIIVLNRTTKEDREVSSDLATDLFRFCQLSRRQRIDLRNRAERLTETFDWSVLAKSYFEVYERLERRK